MSIKDIEIVTKLYDAFNRRDLNQWLAAFAEDAEWSNMPTGEMHVGAEGQRRNYQAWNVPFPAGQCVGLSIKGGNGVVVAEFVGSGKHAGPLVTPDGEIPPIHNFVELQFCDVHELRDGAIVRTRRYWDQASAAAQLEA